MDSRVTAVMSQMSLINLIELGGGGGGIFIPRSRVFKKPSPRFAPDKLTFHLFL